MDGFSTTCYGSLVDEVDSRLEWVRDVPGYLIRRGLRDPRAKIIHRD